jgi:transcriptional regulator of acetoin/glycerol metabolism
VEQRALTIHRDQHFLSRNALLSCTTAPIFNERGELAAALDVSSCRADLTEGFAQLIATAVMDAAQRIEAENFRLAFPKSRSSRPPTIAAARPCWRSILTILSSGRRAARALRLASPRLRSRGRCRFLTSSPARLPTATPSTRPSGRFSCGRSRVQAAMSPERRGASACRVRRCIEG